MREEPDDYPLVYLLYAFLLFAVLMFATAGAIFFLCR